MITSSRLTTVSSTEKRRMIELCTEGERRRVGSRRLIILLNNAGLVVTYKNKINKPVVTHSCTVGGAIHLQVAFNPLVKREKKKKEPQVPAHSRVSVFTTRIPTLETSVRPSVAEVQHGDRGLVLGQL